MIFITSKRHANSGVLKVVCLVAYLEYLCAETWKKNEKRRNDHILFSQPVLPAKSVLLQY